ncbi:MAG TPA: hypothetical protein VLN59_13885 [Burkholderiales bacterium]|nr:hypothetical protein [Burkholderiales bacterium]
MPQSRRLAPGGAIAPSHDEVPAGFVIPLDLLVNHAGHSTAA